MLALGIDFYDVEKSLSCDFGNCVGWDSFCDFHQVGSV